MEVLFFGLGCQRFWQAVEVDLIGREPVQAGVRPLGVIKLQVFPDGSSGFADRLVGVEIDLLILDRLPHPLDEHVVAPAALTNLSFGDILAPCVLF